MSFQLGMDSADDIIAAVKDLKALLIGSVIRNNCSTNSAEHTRGAYFRKIDDGFNNPYSWAACNAYTYEVFEDRDRIRPIDIALPVQVMREGFKEEDNTVFPNPYPTVDTADTVSPFTGYTPLLLDAPGMVGAVSAHYTVCLKRSGYNDFEVGNIDTRNDAERFAKAVAEVTPCSVAHVVEHKFTESTIGVYWSPDNDVSRVSSS